MTEPREPSAPDLANCDREPIHIPGAIQPHGVLLVLDGAELTVTQVSENCGDHLGRAPGDVLQRPLHALLDAASVAEVQAALAAPRLEDTNPLRLVCGARRFDGILHRHDGVLIAELEPVASPGPPHDLPQRLRFSLSDVQSADSLPALCASAVRAVRRLTEYERVLLYRFDAAGHGWVDAEETAAGLPSYLGLHYPASDVPQQARALYSRNWVRIIPDARYTPARIVPAERPGSGRPLDLSFAVLRSVSPIHLEYLANMGVRASMSISLVVGGQLWGLIGCLNHSGPRPVRYELRWACEMLGRLASLQIAALIERDAAALRTVRRGTLQALADAMRAGGSALEGVLARPADLLSLVGASGAAVVRDGRCTTCGTVPAADRILALAEALGTRGASEPFATAALSELLPAALPDAEVASGLLTFTLPGAPPPRLLWFRPELVQTVNWSGDPRTPATLGPGMRLHARHSFELWKEEVRRRAAPWTAADLEAAAELRRFALEVDLERQVADTQRAVRVRDDLVAIVSHDLKNPLHLIRMQTTLLPRLLAAERTSAQHDRLLESTARIERALAHMDALIHDLLDLATIEAGRFAVTCSATDPAVVIDEALHTLRPLAEAKRIRLTADLGAAPRVLVDRERIFQVLSNLIGNAIRFTPEGGSITVRTAAGEGELLVTVSDTGPGIPVEQIAHIFDRYWQARRTGRADAGLGLYIARGIVEAHGGRIWAASVPGEGAQFNFTLRLA